MRHSVFAALAGLWVMLLIALSAAGRGPCMGAPNCETGCCGPIVSPSGGQTSTPKATSTLTPTPTPTPTPTEIGTSGPTATVTASKVPTPVESPPTPAPASLPSPIVLQFDFNADTPLATSAPTLTKFAEALRRVVGPGHVISITGYACRIGDEGYNKGLSLRRAMSVKRNLEAALQGAKYDFDIVPKGILEPLPETSGCKDEWDFPRKRDCLALNRRVIVIAH